MVKSNNHQKHTPIKTTRAQNLSVAALAGAITTIAFTGCDKKGDAISTAEQADK